MSSPPHPLMHFGMAGWFKIKGLETAYYKPTKAVPDEWPPKYWKFSFETLEEPNKPVTNAAFVDFRRFARIRLIDCPKEDMRNETPLKENGPDPVVDKDVVSVEWLREKCANKRIPIKALLLDQANISGIGNWVGDEIMYDAKIHPEQYSNTLSSSQINQLHKSLHYVCGLAVETKADSSLFPEEWLFKHRWGKGKKDSKNQLPNGAKIVFMTVGGRTSAVVPSVQKKTGKVAGDVKTEDKDESDGDEMVAGELEGVEVEKPAKGRKGSTKARIHKVEAKGKTESHANGDKTSSRMVGTSRVKSEAKDESTGDTASGSADKSQKRKVNAEATLKSREGREDEDDGEVIEAGTDIPPAKKHKSTIKSATNGTKTSVQRTTKKTKAGMQGSRAVASSASEGTPGRRRSARVSGAGA